MTNNNDIWARLLRWLSGRFSSRVIAMIVGVGAGIVIGTLIYILKQSIGIVTHLVSDHLDQKQGNWFLIVIPLAGIVLTYLFQRYILHENIEHGVEQIEARIRAGHYRLGGRMIYSPMIANTLTLGFGGSAGAEGPSATVGAAIGSRLGSAFRLPPQQMRLMIGCGAGAGIAAIFKSPVGGVLFTLEVMGLELTTMSVIALTVCCLTSSMTTYLLSGCTYDINFVQTIPFELSILPYVLILGVVCGLYSVYYSWVNRRLRSAYEAVGNRLTRSILSGTALGLMVFLFPTLYGEGYGSLSHLINGEHYILTGASIFGSLPHSAWLLMAVTAGILIFKPAAACSTTSGGGVAGDFAPTLFAGAMAGFLFAMVANTVFGLDLPTSNFAFIGMGAVMAGAVRAPLMSVFIAAEMSDGYQFLLPLLLAAAISYGMVVLVTSRHQTAGAPTPRASSEGES